MPLLARLDLRVLLLTFNYLFIIFYSNKGAKAVQWGKDSLSANDIGKLDTHMQWSEVGPLSFPVYKDELKMDQRPQCIIRAKTINLLEENIGGNLHDIGVSSDPDMTPK